MASFGRTANPHKMVKASLTHSITKSHHIHRKYDSLQAKTGFVLRESLGLSLNRR